MVLLLFPAGLEFIAAFLSCLYAGLVAVPTYPPRGGQRDDPRLRAVAGNARPRWVLTTATIMRRAWPPDDPAQARASWIATDKIRGSGGGDGEDWRPPRLTADSLAYLQYTSGSTSTPKGVRVSHGNLLHNLEMIHRAFGQSERSVVVGWLPLFHDMGLIGNVLETLYAGASAILMSPMAFLRRPLRWLEAITRYRATTSGGPDFAYDLCCRKIQPAERARLDLSSWQVAFSGAEPVRAATLERFAVEFGDQGFRSKSFYPCYGLAEATLFVTGGGLDRGPVLAAFDGPALEQDQVLAVDPDTDAGRTLVGCGRAWHGQRLAIVDPRSGHQHPDGRVGEIWLTGLSVADGYWRQDETSEDNFTARLTDAPDQGPFLRTGDLGFVEGGELFVTGRLKDLIIIRGRNHYPQDIEASALASHPDLEPAGSAAFSVDRTSTERLIVVLELQRRKIRGADLEAIRGAVRRAVAENHQIQVYEVVLIRPGKLPRTTSGKVRRRACRAAYFAKELITVAPPEPASDPDESANTLSKTSLSRSTLLALPSAERRARLIAHLRRRAAGIAGLARTTVDPELPLTALGLDSLMAVEFSAGMEDDLGATLSPPSLLTAPSLKAVADRLLEDLAANAGSGQLADAITAAAAVDHHPLSYGQGALWLLEQLNPGTPTWIVAGAATVRGELDPAAWTRALQEVVDRHPTLRTTFETVGGKPRQQVHDRLPPEILQQDASTWSEPELRARVADAAYRPFDLANGPLVRCGIFHRRAAEQVIFLALHHLISDLWSLGLLLRELAALYQEQTGGEPATLERPRVDYVDYVAWQRRRLAATRGEELWDYRREQLAGDLPRLDLPTDRPRPAIRTTHGASVNHRLGAERTAALETLARSRRTTFYTVALAAFEALLFRYSGQHELLVGSPTAGRERAELGGVCGYFVNPVALRVALDSAASFTDLLEQNRRLVGEAFAHQDFPFPLLVERLEQRRDPSRAPLFDAFFVFQQTRWLRGQDLAGFALSDDGAQLKLAGLSFESLGLERRGAQFDLMLLAAPIGQELGLTVEFNSDLFDPSTIRRLLGHYENVLGAIAAKADRRLDELPLLGAAERTQLLVEWSSSAPRKLGEPTCLHHIFAEQARRSPGLIAVVDGDGDGDGELTYRQLHQRALRLAARLRKLGVGPETAVGLCLGRSRNLLVGLLGILEAGGAFVPLDPSYPAERLKFMLEDSGVEVVVTDQRSAQQLPEGPVPLQIEGLDTDTTGANGSSGPTATPHNLAYVIYTSGSTGRPKGVAIEHRSAARLLDWAGRTFSRDRLTAVLASTSICFDLSIFEIFAPLSQGGKEVLADSALHLPQLPAADEVTLINTVPSAFAELLRLGKLSPALRTVNLAGEPLRRDLVRRAHAAGVEEVYNLFGPSEDTTYSTWALLAAGDSDEPVIGQPIDGTRVLLPDRRGRPLPIGIAGELHLGGDGLARGYLHRPGLTAERFVPDGLSGATGQRLYRTGDLVRFRGDGQLEFLGRLDNQVKVRGFRIELGEIETALLKQPAVREGVVDVCRDSQGGQRLVAYYVPEGDTGDTTAEPPSPDQFRRPLQLTLPDYMVPAVFVPLAALPRTANGKIDRAALPEPDAQAALPPGSALPRSAIERQLAKIWCQVLGVEKVGRDQNFFDLGGHSLLLVEVHSRLAEIVDQPIAAVELFRYPTIRVLAQHLSQQDDGGPSLRFRHHGRYGSATKGEGAADPAADHLAVIGMAGRFPGAASVEELWRQLLAGKETITHFSDPQLRGAGVLEQLLAEPSYVKARGVLGGIEDFDAGFFDLSPRDAELMDPQHRLLLESAWQALEHAGYGGGCDHPVGVYVGTGMSSYLVRNVLTAHGLVDDANEYQALLANDKDFIATRVAYKLDLKGPAVGVQTACSTSLVAVHLAGQSLRAGECDLALAGGASIGLPQLAGYHHRAGGILSPDGHCRAFADGARGTVPASGAGVVVLKRLAEAVADRDTIYAVIRGSAINNDGALKVGYTAPGVEGQTEVIAAAQRAAGVSPESITYVEAHGTGTELGDPIEVAALTASFASERRGFCALGSVKTNLGHLDAAAGVTGLIKTVLALHHQKIPPSLHCETPHSQINFDAGPFFVNRKLRPWSSPDGPRRAGVSSFGIGGTNAHVVVEEAPVMATGSASRPWQLLPLSARSTTALDRAASDLGDFLAREPRPDLADLAHTLQQGRKTFDHRAVLVCRRIEEAGETLRKLDPEHLLRGTSEAEDRSVAFLFPGQGAQYADMARGLYEAEPGFRDTIDTCADLLDLETDLRQLLFPAAELGQDAAARLQQTANAQPALFVVEYALAKLWMEWGIQPAAMIGHSIGEYVAACLARVFSLEDALALVTARGRLMQALPAGAMLAVPLPENQLAAFLREPLALAAVNAPELCVASGPAEAVADLHRQLDERGIVAQPLHTSHAFHSPMMEPALEAFAAEVEKVDLRPPEIPFATNLSGQWATAETVQRPAYWVEHLRHTVRFADGLQLLLQEPDRILLEVGPGRTLANLVRRQQRDDLPPALTSLRHPQAKDDDLAYLLRTLGQLWLTGVEPDWQGFTHHEQRRRVALPTYPFERQRYWIEPGVGLSSGPRSGGSLDKAPPEDWLYLPAWTRQALPEPVGDELEPVGKWLVLLDSEGLGEQLAKKLEAAGRQVLRVLPGNGYDQRDDGTYTVQPARRADFDSLLKALGAVPRRILHCWMADSAPGDPTSSSFDDVQQRGFYSLLALTQALAAGSGSEPISLVVLTVGAQEVTGEEALNPDKAPILGLCQVVPQEAPHLRCRSIDVTLPAATGAQARWLADQLLSELESAAPQPAVAYRGSHRWVPGFTRLGSSASTPEPRLRSGGVYLILGGLGRIGLRLAEFLAREYHAKLALVGRSAIPPPQDWQHEIEQLGGELWIGQADIADRQQTEEAYLEVRRRFGTIHGVIHAASEVGEGAARPFLNLRPADCEHQFRAKTKGLEVLADLLTEQPTDSEPPDFCLLCSSLAALLGGLGFAAYAAANRYMDLFAARHSRIARTPWISVDWDAWLFEEDAARATALAADAAELALTPEEGVGAFARVLALAPPGQVMVSTADLQARVDRWLDPTATTSEPTVHPRPTLQSTYVAPAGDLEQTLAQLWSRLLGIDRVGVHDNFFELGGNSLIGVQLVAEIKQRLDIQISPVSLYETPTLRSLARWIEGESQLETQLKQRQSRGEKRRRRQRRRS